MRRLISKTPDASLNQPSIAFTYNDLGQRATMTDASGTTAYSYDTRNRLQSKQTPFGTLSYGYDAAGNIETLRSSNANGVSVDCSYDELNRLSAAKDNRLVGNQTTTYSFDAVGNLQSYAYPNQVTTSYAYNDLNRLTAMTVSNQLGGLQSYAYTLGATGNRTKVVEASGRTVDYVYDDLYRLTSETIANSQNNGQITYQFDAVGNRLQRNSSVTGVANQSPTYDNNDRLNSDVYDNNGSTKVSNGTTYGYDFENRLTGVSNGITIVYDGDGNRVSKTANGVTTNYLVDTNNLTGYAQVVEELQNNQVVKTYTYGLDLISQRSASGVNFFQHDGHGSVRGLTDASANLTDTYAYDAFGTIIEQTGTTVNNYLYAGEQFDRDLGFYYNRARYLNVTTGRFISQDTYEGNASDPRSLHQFSYGANDGVNKIDPSGNSWSVGSIAVSVTVGVIIAAFSVPPLLTSLTRSPGAGLGNEPAINLDTQPIIVEGSGWDESIAMMASTDAADFWNRWAKISVNVRPIVRLQGLPTSIEGKSFDEGLLRAKLAEQGISSKHLTIFLNGISTQGVQADEVSIAGTSPLQTHVSLSALNYSYVNRWFLRTPASATIAHEWGHGFGLEHTLVPGLMATHYQPLSFTYFQNTLSVEEIRTARNGSRQFQ